VDFIFFLEQHGWFLGCPEKGEIGVGIAFIPSAAKLSHGGACADLQ
jgi:hypothetical protein